MSTLLFVKPDEIRARFSRAMSDMYQQEVPQYGDLLALVAEINQQVMTNDPLIAQQLRATGEVERLDQERHGAIRVGTPAELSMLRRLFAVMGMSPVGYYDLGVAGVPVHSTAFRAIHESALQVSPFRVFTSLLRLELIEQPELREMAQQLLDKRAIFTPAALELIALSETQGGLNETQAEDFIQQALETFRWHVQATVNASQYQQLHDQHRLIADVVAFKGPHINHLTPRVLDIDAAQHRMPKKGISPKAVIEGPPPRQCPILLRQTSFKALEEQVNYLEADGSTVAGHHTARFGEIEQRGAALTPKGRALYDQLLQDTNSEMQGPATESTAVKYYAILNKHFAAFPDDYQSMRQQQLAWFRYFATAKGIAAKGSLSASDSLEPLIDNGYIASEPLVYEDFLPVSAAGIFQSNLGGQQHEQYAASANQTQFEQHLGAKVIDELQLYQATQQRSLEECAQALGLASL